MIHRRTGCSKEGIEVVLVKKMSGSKELARGFGSALENATRTTPDFTRPNEGLKGFRSGLNHFSKGKEVMK